MSGGATFDRVEAGRLRGLQNRRHGMTRSSEHRIWRNMRQRCENPNDDHYERYGAVGISVCERWSVFENFLADMGPRPSSKHSIDRKDGTGNYEPGNCRWATALEQNNNLRTNIRIEHGGVTRTLGEWARIAGLRIETLRKRIKSGWKFDDAISQVSCHGLRRPS